MPVINENDAVATAEIKVGDNDNLSASVAVLGSADLLILLTDQPGLMTANPAIDPAATLIRQVEVLDDTVWKLAGGATSGLGTGGMATKLQAAQTARSSGIDTVIAGIRRPDFLLRVIDGEPEHTAIPKTVSRLESRKRWILAGPSSSGKLLLDLGAVTAVLKNRKSLLAKGVTSVDGTFHRGDVVCLIAPDHSTIARGLARYGSQELRKICGLHSDQILAELGFHLGDAVVHRDDLVTF